MEMLHVAVLLMVAVGVSGADAAGTNLGFDFMVLVRQWGPTFCETKTCSQPAVAAFTIHGLWPNYANGGYPQDCDPTNKFSTTNLPQPLLNQMSCEWVSYTGSNAAFWSYEWGKHGTCALPLFGSQAAYFNATIALNNQYEPNLALTAAGVNPSLAPSLTRTQLQSTLQKAWGVAPLVSCSSADVFEIWLCVGTDLKAMTCPSSVRPSGCPTSALALPAGGKVPQVCAPYYGIPSAPSSPSGGNSSSSTTTTTTTTTTSAAAAAPLKFSAAVAAGWAALALL